MATLDHLIVTVNDRDDSVEFYTKVMGFGHEPDDGPFTVIRVSPDTTLQLAPWGTEGGDHLAFALWRRRVRRRLRPDPVSRSGLRRHVPRRRQHARPG